MKGEELRSLLSLLPQLAAQDGKPLTEAARNLKLDERGLMNHLQLLSRLRWGDYDSGELIDCWVEDGQLFVHTGGLFDHVLRFTPEEMMALLLGAIRLKEEGAFTGDQILDSMLERIEDALGRDDSDLRPSLQLATEKQDPHENMVRQSLMEKRRLRMWYYSASSDRYRKRDVDVWQLFRYKGNSYFQGLDQLSGEVRTFRVDRVGRCELTETRFTALEAEMLPPARPVEQADEIRAQIRLFGAFGRIAREQEWPGLELTPSDVVWRPRLNDPESMLRSLLQHADNLRIEAPPELRQSWEDLLCEMARRHGVQDTAAPI